ncbi:MAG: LPXTG cell wall anchor domain-containing protein [Acidimicrobiia bacterium]|nr:LPXTG cell wall anchor domain-containing protein [Acidimicrobiia bacterium]
MGDGESMDDSGEMGDEESMDDSGEMGDEELPETGHESGLLAIVAASVLVAGLLVVGAGRRLRTAIR